MRRSPFRIIPSLPRGFFCHPGGAPHFSTQQAAIFPFPLGPFCERIFFPSFFFTRPLSSLCASFGSLVLFRRVISPAEGPPPPFLSVPSPPVAFQTILHRLSFFLLGRFPVKVLVGFLSDCLRGLSISFWGPVLLWPLLFFPGIDMSFFPFRFLFSAFPPLSLRCVDSFLSRPEPLPCCPLVLFRRHAFSSKKGGVGFGQHPF